MAPTNAEGGQDNVKRSAKQALGTGAASLITRQRPHPERPQAWAWQKAHRARAPVGPKVVGHHLEVRISVKREKRVTKHDDVRVLRPQGKREHYREAGEGTKTSGHGLGKGDRDTVGVLALSPPMHTCKRVVAVGAPLAPSGNIRPVGVARNTALMEGVSGAPTCRSHWVASLSDGNAKYLFCCSTLAGLESMQHGCQSHDMTDDPAGRHARWDGQANPLTPTTRPNKCPDTVLETHSSSANTRGRSPNQHLCEPIPHGRSLDFRMHGTNDGMALQAIDERRPAAEFEPHQSAQQEEATQTRTRR